MSGAKVGACSGCQPCQDCGHHVPKARIPALCEECAVRRPDIPGWIHPGEWRITLADARVALCEESADLIPGVLWTDAQLAVVRDLTARACRAEQAVERVRELVREAEWQEKYSIARQFGGAPFPVSISQDAIRRALNGPQSAPSDRGRAEGVGRMYSGGSRSGLTSQDETEGRR